MLPLKQDRQLPEPSDARVKLTQMPSTTVAALRFSGSTGDPAVTGSIHNDGVHCAGILHMSISVIIWDLETVPDLRGFAAANDLVGRADAEIREVLGNKFPKHIYHSILCIGALVAYREDDHWVVDALGAPYVGERTEKQLIAAFCDRIAELTPRVVSFNGNS